MSDGFLARWTRRKRAVRAAERDERRAEEHPGGQPVDHAPDVAGPVRPTPDPAADERAQAGAPPHIREPAEAEPPPELPSLDALTRESDLTPFLRAGVPTALRNAALRRMWSLDPAIRDFVSEAREYAYDWNSPGGVPGLGPLLPSDDVQAMLRRIVGGVPGEASAPEAGTPAGEVVADAVVADDPDAAVQRHTEAGRDVPDERGEAVGAPPPVAAIAAAEPEPSVPASPIAATADAPAPPTAVTGQAPLARLRRHGGAMPS